MNILYYIYYVFYVCKYFRHFNIGKSNTNISNKIFTQNLYININAS